MDKVSKNPKLLTEGVIFDAYVLYTFLKKLTTPFNKTKAFQLGLIDAKGKVLRKRATLKTTKEKEAFSILDLLIWNIKKAIEKLPGGKTKLASYLAAFFLLKEQNQISEKSLDKFLTELNVIFDDPHQMMLIEEIVDELEEDAPANNAGSGGIAGLGVNGPDDIRVNHKPKMLKRKDYQKLKLKAENDENGK